MNGKMTVIILAISIHFETSIGNYNLINKSF